MSVPSSNYVIIKKTAGIYLYPILIHIIKKQLVNIYTHLTMIL